MKIHNLIYSLFLPALLFPLAPANVCHAQQDGDPIAIGTYRVLHSEILNEERLLFVHLPEGYDDSKLSYPVLYILYVQLYNYFADAAIVTEKLGGSGDMPPMIIVGVANTNRYRDLLPIPTAWQREGGGAGNFLRFMEEELIPHIDQTYRTKPFRILAAPQASAVFSLYALINKPSLFNAMVSGNPFMNPDNAAHLYPQVESLATQRDTLKHFLYIQCEKDEPPQNLDYAARFKQLLEAEKLQELRYTIEFSEPSGYFIPPLPLEKAFRSLFNGYALPQEYQIHSLQDILDHYARSSAAYGFSVDPPDHLLMFKGVELKERGKAKEAIEIFAYQLKMNPKSLNAHFQLGETYRGLGELEKAREYFQGFLKIRDTDAAMVQRRVQQIDKMIRGSAAWRIEQAIKTGGITTGLKQYKTIKADPASALYFEESEFNELGYRLMRNGDTKAALEIFKLNLELYPASANVHDSLGEAWMKLGDAQKAIRHYRKSLELNPNNQNAAKMLQELENR